MIWFLQVFLLQLEAGRNFETFIVEYLRPRALFKHWQIYHENRNKDKVGVPHSTVRLSFVDLRWAQLYVSLVFHSFCIFCRSGFWFLFFLYHKIVCTHCALRTIKTPFNIFVTKKCWCSNSAPISLKSNWGRLRATVHSWGPQCTVEGNSAQ